MRIVDLQLEAIQEAPWNANEMEPAMEARLRHSIQRFGLVAPLVVRQLDDGAYETIGGAQRLRLLREEGKQDVVCVVVEADEAEARLLSQALNHIFGHDNPGLRAELLRKVLAQLPEEEVLDVLPDSQESLAALA